MARTCVSAITPVDIPNKIVRIECVITEGEMPAQTVIIENADISTPEKKTEAANIVWRKYLAKYNGQMTRDNIKDELISLKGTLNSNIEGRTI